MVLPPVETLSSHLAALRQHPRAVPWKLSFHSGRSSSAPRRDYVLFAPPTEAAGRLILFRLHNGVILLNPAAVELSAPVDDERLGPLWPTIQGIHRIAIARTGQPLSLRFVDVPSLDLPVVAPQGGLAVGLDIGGTGMKACAIQGELSEKDAVVRMASAETWPDGEYGMASLERRARALIAEVAGGVEIGSLGVGLAAPMGVGGRVLELSTVLRERVGDPAAFDGFLERVATGLCAGPTAIFNDLSNLGRYLSSEGHRRLVRLQIGTSFGGCWIDSDGMVQATEMGRLVVDVGPGAIPHTYLPLAGAMKTYLSNLGLAGWLERAGGGRVDPRTSGHHLRELLESGDPLGKTAVEWMGTALRGVIEELHALLPGVTEVSCGGGMLLGPLGRLLPEAVGEDLPVEFSIAPKPAHDGAIAAALAPRVAAPLRGMKRVG